MHGHFSSLSVLIFAASAAADCRWQPATGCDSCYWSNDGVCDEPFVCANGTDCTDCGNGRRLQGQSDVCPLFNTFTGHCGFLGKDSACWEDAYILGVRREVCCADNSKGCCDVDVVKRREFRIAHLEPSDPAARRCTSMTTAYTLGVLITDAPRTCPQSVTVVIIVGLILTIGGSSVACCLRARCCKCCPINRHSGLRTRFEHTPQRGQYSPTALVLTFCSRVKRAPSSADPLRMQRQPDNNRSLSPVATPPFAGGGPVAGIPVPGIPVATLVATPVQGVQL